MFNIKICSVALTIVITLRIFGIISVTDISLIDGAADDEVTFRRNTEAYDKCDLIPNVLTGVKDIDMSTTVMGHKIEMPALQRLFHPDGEIGVGLAAEKYGTMFGVSSLGQRALRKYLN